jgi:hypothetical protein
MAGMMPVNGGKQAALSLSARLAWASLVWWNWCWHS